MKLYLFLACLLTAFILQAQPLTRVSVAEQERGIAVTAFDVARDPTGELPFDSIHSLAWAPVDRTHQLSLRPWHWQWFRFELQNTSPDSFAALLIPPYAHWISFWTQTPDTLFEQRAGGFNNLSRRPFRPNAIASEVKLPPGGQAKYWLGLKTYESKRIDPPVLWLKTPEMVLDELREARADATIHAVHYMLVFLLLGAVFSILYLTTRDRATGWYALYVWGFLLLYLRKYDLRPGVPSFFAHFREWALHVEIVLILVMFIAYTGFVRHFLDIAAKNPRLDRYLKTVMQVLAVFIAIELLVFALCGLKEGFQLFTLIRIAGLGAFGATVFMGIGKLRSKYAWFVLIGICLLLAPALFTLLIQCVEGKSYEPINDVWRIHETAYLPLHMYSMKLGIVLELLCFSFAIGYKLREEKEARQREWLVWQQAQSDLKTTAEALGKQAYLNQAILSAKTEKQRTEFLSDVYATIQARLADPHFGVEELARAVHISRAQLHRRVTEETGQSPSQLLLSARLKKALLLLQTTRHSVAEVAWATGFSEANHFSRVFKKEIGKTPKEVRDGV